MAAGSTINVRIDRARWDRILALHGVGAEAALRALAFDGKRIVVRSFGRGTRAPLMRDERGRFIKGSGRKIHVVSRPGDPPNVDTGRLRSSIYVRKHGRLVYAIGTEVEYAPHLEFGTVKMAARPFMRPMAEELPAALDKLFDRFLEKL